MQLSIVGHMVISDGRSVMVSRKPSYPVVKYVTKSDFDKNVQTIASRFYVCECIDGIIVYYIKGRNHFNHNTIN